MVNDGLLGLELNKRKLPGLLKKPDGTMITRKEDWEQRRKEIRGTLCENLTGFPPEFELCVNGSTVKEDRNSYGGKAFRRLVDLQITTPYSHASFPFQLCIPKETEKPPVFLNLSFTPEAADGLGEEILDNGFAVANVYYQDIAADMADNYYSGVGRICRRNNFNSWGKVSMWAWGASRIMDYLMTLEEIDGNRVAVTGHSRLGKAALVCGAFDERFSLVVSNNSGGGAALFRGKEGEGIEDLAKGLSRLWFCDNFYGYGQRTEDLPFDQHFLLAMAAPRNLYVTSASMDAWADPKSEFLACVAASPVYELLGWKGLVHNNAYPEDNQVFSEGRIGYHLRKGTHHMGRFDWNRIMEYRRQHSV